MEEIKMSEKVLVPKEVAAAIAHYVSLADTKTEALTDILSMGYEATRSEIILRHFDGNHDELMQALICGYEVEKTPEEKVCEFFDYLETQYRENLLNRDASKYHLAIVTLKRVLNDLGIKIAGVNA
jgi:DNA integrity scanning protein DisA with diadenylate cyclase activity